MLIYVGFVKLEEGKYTVPKVATDSLDKIIGWVKQVPTTKEDRVYTVLTSKGLD